MRALYKIENSGEITKEEIKQILLKYYERKYAGAEVGRSLDEFNLKSSGNFTIFSLEGTPPKGYALYVNELMKLILLGPNGEKVKIFSSIRIAQ